MKIKTRIIDTRHADDSNQVITVEIGRPGHYRRAPCPGCPWKVANSGYFPAEAFRLSAPTSYDMATHKFGCHESGTNRPATCAGFLLRGAEHNLAVRLARLTGSIQADITDGGHALHSNYRAMAIANGVAPEEEVLAPCRS